MAKFVKDGNVMNIIDLQDAEVIALLKINVNCTLEFGNTENYIQLYDRLEKNGINFIEIVGSDNPKERKIIGYDVLIGMITKNLSEGVLKVVIDKWNFQAKEPLLLMLNDLKSDIIYSCMMLDYDLQNHVFSIINKKLPDGCSDKLYYFEDNQSILAFTKDGPMIIYGKISSVEDLICN